MGGGMAEEGPSAQGQLLQGLPPRRGRRVFFVGPGWNLRCGCCRSCGVRLCLDAERGAQKLEPHVGDWAPGGGWAVVGHLLSEAEAGASGGGESPQL